MKTNKSEARNPKSETNSNIQRPKTRNKAIPWFADCRFLLSRFLRISDFGFRICGVLAILVSAGTVSGQVPQLISYQGRVAVNGTNFNGTGQFRFALVNAAGTTTFWSNGVNAVSLPVSDGLYSVLLGDTGIANMTFAIPAPVFTNGDVRLRVSFNDGVTGFQTLSPDQRLAAVGYAMIATTVSSNAITTAQIADGTVANADIAAGAAIADTKLATIATAGKVADSALSPNVSLLGPSVESAEITDGTIGTADIGTIDAGKIGGGDLMAARLKVGAGHTLSGTFATIAGGTNNTATSAFAAIGGGIRHSITGQSATIGGGVENNAGGAAATVAGGQLNVASGAVATVGGGLVGTASAAGATVGGGGFDGITAIGNTASAPAATVGGGLGNQATMSYATVGGGVVNVASGPASYIGGGSNNTVSGSFATVGGGRTNSATGTYATISGGEISTASGSYATIGGGALNIAFGDFSTIAGGSFNSARAERATLGGGSDNQATNLFATVPGGRLNRAGGEYSLAAGRRAQARHNGSFVWADSTDVAIASTTNNQFTARCSGGVRFFSNTNSTLGVQLTANATSWTVLSDREAKENLEPINVRHVLGQLAGMPLCRWNYKDDPAKRPYIGPTAQDFHSAFGLGDDDRRISTQDLDGVALAAIQGLYEELKVHKSLSAEVLKEKDTKIAELEKRLAEIERTLQRAAKEK
jgi:hypothetical protein